MRAHQERQLAMTLRRGRIMQKMRSDEERRIFSLLHRMDKQEEAMGAMAERRKELAEVREQQRRLKQLDPNPNPNPAPEPNLHPDPDPRCATSSAG